MEYRNNPSQQTLVEIEATLAFIRKHQAELVELPGDSKWTSGYKVFRYDSDGEGLYTFMVGALKNGKVTWHIMPLYGVTEIKDKWLDQLQPFVSGKSCINFKKFSDLPEDALIDIVKRGSKLFKEVMIEYHNKRKK